MYRLQNLSYKKKTSFLKADISPVIISISMYSSDKLYSLLSFTAFTIFTFKEDEFKKIFLNKNKLYMF